MGSPAGWLHAEFWSRHSIGREGRLSHRPLLVPRDVWRTALPAEDGFDIVWPKAQRRVHWEDLPAELQMRAEHSVAMEATTRQFRRAESEVLGDFLRRGVSTCT